MPSAATRVLRTWYVWLIGGLLTVLWVAYLLNPHPEYWIKSEILFVESQSDVQSAFLVGPNEQLVPFVSVLERRLNQGTVLPRLNSRDAPLYGTGVRDGYRLEIPNAGMQWSPSFPRPSLTVEVVGESLEQVQQRHAEIVERVVQMSKEFQRDQGYPKEDRIVAVPQEPTPEPVDVGSSQASRIRGAAVALLVGLAVTILIAAELDRRVRRR